MHQDICLIQHW